MLMYSIAEINEIRDNGFIFELSDTSLEVINTISEIVGASTYIRTPIFPKKEKRNRNNYKEREIDPNFKATVMKKEDTNVVKVRSLLNKITKTNYDVIYDEINSIIKNVADSENIEELNKVSDFIFLTAGTNKAFSDLYAKMYKDCIDKYNVFQKILNEHVEKHLELFKTVDVVDPQVDYEKFCVLNRINDERRALSLFISNLYNLDTVDTSIINNIIELLHDNLEKNIILEDKSGLVTEISENTSIIIMNSILKLKDTSKWSEIVEYVEKMKKRKHKDYNSLPSKSIFKYMDIYDKIKDLDK